MKIRTDFVTNSSSSSFIFKEFSQERVKKAVENKLSATPPENEWEEWYYEYARDLASSMVAARFSEYSLYKQQEVYCWYRDEVIGNWLGIKREDDWNDRKSWEEKMKKAISKLEYTSTNADKWTVVFILDIYDSYIDQYMGRDIAEEEKSMKISYENLYDYIWEYVQLAGIEETNILFNFYMPCSFDNQKLRWSVDLRNSTIQDAWFSTEFEEFRNHLKYACPDCIHRSDWIGDRSYKVYAWSNCDYSQLKHEIRAKEITDSRIDAFMDKERWIDYQAVFGKRYEFNRAVSLKEALICCNIEADGRFHDGLDDATNTAKLIKVLEQDQNFVICRYEFDEKEEKEIFGFSLGDLFAGLNLECIA